MSKCLVLFVEGDTEVEFYKQVVFLKNTTVWAAGQSTAV